MPNLSSHPGDDKGPRPVELNCPVCQQKLFAYFLSPKAAANLQPSKPRMHEHQYKKARCTGSHQIFDSNSSRVAECLADVHAALHPDHIQTREELVRRLRERADFIEGEIETDNFLNGDAD